MGVDLGESSYCVGELERMKEGETVIGKIDGPIYFQFKKKRETISIQIVLSFPNYKIEHLFLTS